MLTTRQQCFADACMRGADPVAAYIQAGYRDRNAAVAARRLLKAPAVQAYMEKTSVQHQAVANADEILQFLTSVLRGEAGSEKDRLRAAELLGKRQGLFNDKGLGEPTTEVVIVDDLGG